MVNKADYESLLKKIELKKEKRFVDFLESLPFFSNQSRVALIKLKYLMQQRDYIKNQEVISEDSPATKVFIVRSGEFAIYKMTEKFPVDVEVEQEEKEKLTL